jgi:hypothetical protein
MPDLASASPYDACHGRMSHLYDNCRNRKFHLSSRLSALSDRLKVLPRDVADWLFKSSRLTDYFLNYLTMSTLHSINTARLWLFALLHDLSLFHRQENAPTPGFAVCGNLPQHNKSYSVAPIAGHREVCDQNRRDAAFPHNKDKPFWHASSAKSASTFSSNWCNC